LATLATIADIVPLKDENRIIVKEGLKHLDLLPVGVKILLKNTFGSLKEISSTDIAYKIAPKINSAGRLDDANIALKLFVSNDLKEINKSLKSLENLNNLRKNLCENIFEECKKLAEKNEHEKIIILFNKKWDIGVLGIVCAKLCEEFGVPTILFGENGGELKGSCRTVGNIDAVEIFENAKDLLVNFGGHKKAGGLSLKEENLQKFVNRCEEFLKINYDKQDFLVEKNYDLCLDEQEISTDFVKQLKILEPCGFENSVPVFKIELGSIKVAKMNKNPQHLMISLKNNVEFLSFNDTKNFENFLNFSKKTVLAELSINKFNGKESVKGIIKYEQFDCPKRVLDLKLKANYLTQLSFECDEFYRPKYFTSLKQIEKIFDEKTILLSYDINKKIEKEHVNKTSFCVNNFNQFGVVFGINSVEDLAHYKKIVLLEKPLDSGFVSFLHQKTKATIYVPTDDDFSFGVEVSREKFLDVYYSLVKAINKSVCVDDDLSYFEILQTRFDAKFDYATFCSAIMVFKELNLIEQKPNVENKICFKLSKIKTDLENSKIFQKLKKL
ncbi:MAG: DHHA1 domain-containing protein, partial [Christensenellales bacterium]